MAILKEKVLEIHHWTEKTFSFKTTRDRAFRFKNGEFAMIGLEIDGRPLLRAYSVVSPNHEDHLEFLSIKVPNGPLTSKLQHIKLNDEILVNSKPTGTLVCDYLLPGRNLFLFSTGTGLAPFMSIIRDPETYEKFDEVLLFQTCRFNNELEYGKSIVRLVERDDMLSQFVSNKLRFIPTATREKSEFSGRVTDWLKTDKFLQVTGRDLNSVEDRVMICGSMEMLNDFKNICLQKGLKEGSNSAPADFVIEKAFVD